MTDAALMVLVLGCVAVALGLDLAALVAWLRRALKTKRERSHERLARTADRTET
jgi:hypothetical protein